MIRFTCPYCGKSLKAEVGSMGKRTRCPRCRSAIEVPKQGKLVLVDHPLPKQVSAGDVDVLPVCPPEAETSDAPPLAEVAGATEDVGPGRRLWPLLVNLSSQAKTGLMAFGVTMAFGLTIVLGLAVGVLLWAGVAPRSADEMIVDITLLVCVGGALVVGLVVLLVILIRGRKTACPECGKRWAITFIERYIIGRKKCYGLVTRYAHTRSIGWTSGTKWHTGGHPTSYGGPVSSSGTTSWQERVPVIRTTYGELYRCKYCLAEFVRERIKEVEDFDIERE
jgi:DNA-directed RNA polymerase subunit RPC12/RpoP